MLFENIEPPDIDDVSHHPEQWPGRYSYRIFGVPFIQWIYQHYGWQPGIIRGLEVAANGRWYEPRTDSRENEDNVLEAKEAYTTGVEIYWPLLNLQQGYKTLPLFLHRLRISGKKLMNLSPKYAKMKRYQLRV